MHPVYMHQVPGAKWTPQFVGGVHLFLSCYKCDRMDVGLEKE